MIRIIDGKRYNTETATEIAEYSNRLGSGDFRNLSETLYRTPSGAWFIDGKGGAMTEYRESCGNNSWCGGHELKVLTGKEALQWLEEHDEVDAIETYFQDEIQDA